MSSSNATNPGGIYPDSISKDPLTEPKPSSRQDALPNQDAALKAADSPENTSNPVKKGTPSVEHGTTSVNKPDSTSAGGGEGEKKGIGEKIKEKLTK